MRNRALAVLAVLCLGFAPLLAAAVDPAEYDKAIKTLRCDCGCHPQSLKDCACGYAAKKREEIHGMMAGDPAGGGAMSGEALIALFVERHGEQILIAPAATGFNLVAWLGPLAGLVLASTGVFWLIGRWRRQRPAVAAVEGGPPLEADDPYLKRLNRQLEELD